MKSRTPNKTGTKNRAYKLAGSILLALALLCVGAYILITPHYVHTDEMFSPPISVERNGIYYLQYPTSDAPGGVFTGDISSSVLFDYEKGIRYVYAFQGVKDSYLHLWFNKGIREDYFCVNAKGEDADQGRYYKDYEKDEYTVEDYKRNPGLMFMCFIRIYYENPDGTYVLMWEHPEAEAIADALGGKLPEPTPDLRWEIMDGKR